MSSRKQSGLNHGTTINQMISRFENKCCKVLGVILFILVIFIWIQLSGCCSETPAPPSDYIDEVDMDNFVYTILPSNPS